MPSTAELFAQAVACHQASKYPETERLCRQILAADPTRVDARYLLAVTYHGLGRLDEAIAHLRQTVALKPDHVEAHNHLGGMLAEQGDVTASLDEAIANFQHAHRLAPNSPEVSDNLRLTLATREYRRGWELAQQKKPSEAAACYRAALELHPDYADAHNALAAALSDQGQFGEAVTCCERAIALRPDWAEAHRNLAIPLTQQRKFDLALAHYQRALDLKNDFADAHLGRALLSLLLGNMPDGWLEYEWRWKVPGREESFPDLRWTGEPLAGRTIVLHSEQGHGDTLQFIRYAPMVKAQGGMVIALCQLSLVRLISECAGVDQVIAQGKPLPRFDLQIPMLSLPTVFRTSLDTIPANIPYLSADPHAYEQWRDELATEQAFKIGIAWQGSPTNLGDRARSFPLALFAGIAEMPGVKLYSLQMGAGREQLAEFTSRYPITDVGHRLGDFYNTAALVRNLDLVITCDSAPAHLAGALGGPVWVALPAMSDWRWMLDRTDSPWYPTMRLFRQERAGDWDGVFHKIEQALATQI